MTPRMQAVLGVGCLALAVFLHPAPPAQSEGVVAAIGRSMGGSRVMLIDALFLRAEAQRKAGRVDEAAALYRAVLDLDPANEPATIFLVNVYVDELIPLIPDEEQRFLWWQRARALLDTALLRRPDSASLPARAAGLVLDARQLGGLLETRPETERRRLAKEALVHLRRAVALAPTLPRLGRVHLVQVALFAPEQAADALRHGDDDLLALALEVGEEALRLRGPLLSELRLDEAGPTSLADLLRRGLAAVRAVAAGDRVLAATEIEACRQMLPDWRVPDTLEDVLQR
jgi:tetratricopeptide (TPR) repeat protein